MKIILASCPKYSAASIWSRTSEVEWEQWSSKKTILMNVAKENLVYFPSTNSWFWTKIMKDLDPAILQDR